MMEMEELKKLWTSLDERLNKQEVLKESMIKEMIYSKSNKSVSKLLNYEVWGAATNLLVIPFLVFLCNERYKELLAVKFFAYAMILLCIIFVIWQLIKIRGLIKVDFMKNISHNSLLIRKYSIQLQREKLAMHFVGAIAAFFCILLYASLHASLHAWVFLTCMLLFSSLYTYYIRKSFYNKHIDSIRKSLEELKELEEG
jgi:hypothetical protein